MSEDTTPDVFVHQSDIATTVEQLRYLVQGEYVTFSVKDSGDDTKKAVSVRGIQEGLLMCEIHKMNRERG